MFNTPIGIKLGLIDKIKRTDGKTDSFFVYSESRGYRFFNALHHKIGFEGVLSYIKNFSNSSAPSREEFINPAKYLKKI